MQNSHFNIGQVRQWLFLFAAGASFLLVLIVEFLSHSQALEYVRAHFPALYYFVVARDTLAAVAFVGLGLVLVVAWELKQAKEETPEVTLPVRESAAAANSSIGNINITVPVSTHHNPQQVERPLPSQPPHKSKKRVAVFRPLKFEWLNVKLEQSKVRTFEVAKEKTIGGGGLILPVYNDPAQSDADLEYARAHIVFTDKDSGEKIIVSHAWWIGEHLEQVHLPLGAQKYVLVIAAEKDDGPMALENTVRYDLGNGYKYNDEVIKETALHGLVYQIDVILIHGGGSQFRDSHSFEYRIEQLEEHFD
jgi:hypothetical protein